MRHHNRRPIGGAVAPAAPLQQASARQTRGFGPRGAGASNKWRHLAGCRHRTWPARQREPNSLPAQPPPFRPADSWPSSGPRRRAVWPSPGPRSSGRAGPAGAAALAGAACAHLITIIIVVVARRLAHGSAAKIPGKSGQPPHPRCGRSSWAPAGRGLWRGRHQTIWAAGAQAGHIK